MATDKKSNKSEETVTVSRAQFEKLRAIEAQEKAAENAVAATELRAALLESIKSGAPLKDALAMLNGYDSNVLEIEQVPTQEAKEGRKRAFANRVRFTESEVKEHQSKLATIAGTFKREKAQEVLGLDKNRTYQMLTKALKSGIIVNTVAKGHPVYQVKSTSAPIQQPAN